MVTSGRGGVGIVSGCKSGTIFLSDKKNRTHVACVVGDGKFVFG